MQSRYRNKARSVIGQVIDDNVFGPVQLLPRGDVLELRAKLRERYPFGETRGWAYAVWLEEIRVAIGYPHNRRPVRKTRKRWHAREVMPSMRAWADARGLIRQENDQGHPVQTGGATPPAK